MKNITTIIKKTAADLNLPEDQVEKVINSYWDSITSKMQNLESTTVTIRHVGSFTISKRKLDSLIRRVINRIRFLKTGKDAYKFKVAPKNKEELLEKSIIQLKQCLEKRNFLANLYYKN